MYSFNVETKITPLSSQSYDTQVLAFQYKKIHM